MTNKLLVYTIGIPGEPEENYMQCYTSINQDSELATDVMLNIFRDAWIQRYQAKIKPWIEPGDFEKVCRVMDVNTITMDEFLKLRGEKNS